MRLGVLWTSAEVFCISFKVGHASITRSQRRGHKFTRKGVKCLSSCNFLNPHLACRSEFHESNGKPHFLVCTQSCFIFSVAVAAGGEAKQEEESLNAMLMYSGRGKRKHLRFSSVITQMKFMDAGNHSCGRKMRFEWELIWMAVPLAYWSWSMMHEIVFLLPPQFNFVSVSWGVF